MKIDLGCGANKKEGFFGVDVIALPGVDYIGSFDDYLDRLPDDSVSEVYMSHFIEHLSSDDRIVLFNKLFRVMKPRATGEIICPDWSCAAAYGDPTHKWPPISAWTFMYLNEDWRKINAPHTPYLCDFGGNISKEIIHRITLIRCIITSLKLVKERM